MNRKIVAMGITVVATIISAVAQVVVNNETFKEMTDKKLNDNHQSEEAE